MICLRFSLFKSNIYTLPIRNFTINFKDQKSQGGKGPLDAEGKYKSTISKQNVDDQQEKGRINLNKEKDQENVQRDNLEETKKEPNEENKRR